MRPGRGVRQDRSFRAVIGKRFVEDQPETSLASSPGQSVDIVGRAGLSRWTVGMTDDDSIDRAAMAPSCLHYSAEVVDRDGIVVGAIRIERCNVSPSSLHGFGIPGKSGLDEKESL